MRRVHLRGYPNIRKRLLIHVAGCRDTGPPPGLEGCGADANPTPFVWSTTVETILDKLKKCKVILETHHWI